MKLKDCIKCEYNKDQLSDSILCGYENSVDHRVVDGDNVVMCPKEDN